MVLQERKRRDPETMLRVAIQEYRRDKKDRLHYVEIAGTGIRLQLDRPDQKADAIKAIHEAIRVITK